MKIPSDLNELTALFEKLGARSPESWARSQLSEGINQLQRFLFLRQAWSLILREDDTDWIQSRWHRANWMSSRRRPAVLPSYSANSRGTPTAARTRAHAAAA
jgi:hypothetical protein